MVIEPAVAKNKEIKETKEVEAEAPVPEAKVEETKEESKNPLEMSDEDFLKLNSPPVKKVEETKEPEAKVAETPTDGKTVKEPSADTDTKGEPEKKEPEPPGSKDSKVKAAEPDEKKPEKTEEKSVDYEAFFNQVMQPFKANGKTFEVKTPEEAIRLMQKGAGYGRKLQDMQPHLKVLRMLEKNGLLDEGKLSFLIDLNQKKPDAIKKLIKDGGIDPLDLNTEDKVTYTPTDHAVSDREVAFHQALAEVQAQPGGHETISLINKTWDTESKALLWESPELFDVIQTQRENGVYDQIAAEIDRQKLLGSMDSKTPFLQAYKIAGDHLVKTNGFKQVKSQPGITPQPQVIATRTAVPKPEAQNGDKAAAASPTKAVAATKPSLTVNPLEMADDDFMKQFNGRF
jgi:hypothetical protein